MSERSRTSTTRILARSIAYGVVCGAALGVVSMALLVVSWSLLQMSAMSLSGLLIYGMPAGLVGGVVGLFVGLFGGVALAVTGVAGPGNERMARPVAGVAAAIPFLVLAVPTLTSTPEAEAWVIGGWLWLVVVALMSGATGAFVGPRVAGLEPCRRSAER